MEEVTDGGVARCGSYCSPELRRCEVRMELLLPLYRKKYGDSQGVREVQEKRMGGLMCFGEAHLAGKQRRTASVLRASASKWWQPGGSSRWFSEGKWKGQQWLLIGSNGAVNGAVKRED